MLAWTLERDPPPDTRNVVNSKSVGGEGGGGSSSCNRIGETSDVKRRGGGGSSRCNRIRETSDVKNYEEKGEGEDRGGEILGKGGDIRHGGATNMQL